MEKDEIIKKATEIANDAGYTLANENICSNFAICCSEIVYNKKIDIACMYCGNNEMAI